jgi:hypothetical protein
MQFSPFSRPLIPLQKKVSDHKIKMHRKVIEMDYLSIFLCYDTHEILHIKLHTQKLSHVKRSYVRKVKNPLVTNSLISLHPI